MACDLSIIIVNWNGGRLLTRCIETVVASAPKVTYEIVIVDNGSTDDSLAQLRASEAAAPMIASEQIRLILLAAVDGDPERVGHCCILGSWVGSAYTGGQP